MNKPNHKNTIINQWSFAVYSSAPVILPVPLKRCKYAFHHRRQVVDRNEDKDCGEYVHVVILIQALAHRPAGARVPVIAGLMTYTLGM